MRILHRPGSEVYDGLDYWRTRRVQAALDRLGARTRMGRVPGRHWVLRLLAPVSDEQRGLIRAAIAAAGER